jgi:hypothetical protein
VCLSENQARALAVYLIEIQAWMDKVKKAAPVPEPKATP